VPFRTRPGTATVGVDYVARTGTVTIPAGHTTGAIAVSVLGDRVVEPRETFGVELGDAVGADVGVATATGRILNDDPGPRRRVAIGDATIVEGDDGLRWIRFTVARSVATATPVRLSYGTVGGSAVAGADFVPTLGRATIPAGAASTTVAVAVVPDTVAEGTESFTVRITDVQGAVVSRSTGTGRVLDDD
jgi:Calx-beta domain